jgi:hypothetical protein
MYKITTDDTNSKVFAAFTVADLKRIYNALQIDQMSNDEPDADTAALMERIKRLIPG